MEERIGQPFGFAPYECMCLVLQPMVIEGGILICYSKAQRELKLQGERREVLILEPREIFIVVFEELARSLRFSLSLLCSSYDSDLNMS